VKITLALWQALRVPNPWKLLLCLFGRSEAMLIAFWPELAGLLRHLAFRSHASGPLLESAELQYFGRKPLFSTALNVATGTWICCTVAL
jgi:hypothetical protein